MSRFHQDGRAYQEALLSIRCMAYLVIGLHIYWSAHKLLSQAGYSLIHIDHVIFSLTKKVPLMSGLLVPKLWGLILFLIEALGSKQQRTIKRHNHRPTTLFIYLISLLGLVLFLGNGYLVDPIGKPNIQTIFLYVSTTALGLSGLVFISLPALTSYLGHTRPGDSFGDESDNLPPDWPEWPGSRGPRNPVKPIKPAPSLTDVPTCLN